MGISGSLLLRKVLVVLVCGPRSRAVIMEISRAMVVLRLFICPRIWSWKHIQVRTVGTLSTKLFVAATKVLVMLFVTLTCRPFLEKLLPVTLKKAPTTLIMAFNSFSTGVMVLTLDS